MSSSPGLIELLLSTAATTFLLVALVFWRRQQAGGVAVNTSIPSYTHISYPLLGSLQYFSRHWDFLRSATDNGASSASFHLAQHKLIAISTENRHAFFNDSRFAFALAYAVMLGATPSINKDFLTSIGFDITLGGRSNKLLFALVRKERINTNLSTLYSYATDGVASLQSTTNPFDTIYATVFRLTIATVASQSLAARTAHCDELQGIFRELDKSGTPFTILFPWFMGWERIQRFYLMKRFHNIFTLAALFAGIANTGIVAAYILCDLATHPSYITQIRAELAEFVASFNPDESIPLAERIASVPSYEEWLRPGRLPVLDRCLKETIRLRLSTPLHRLNDTGRELDFMGMRVPHKTILSFHTNFLHHNEEIYSDPGRWDPERFGEDRMEDKGAPLSFAGWGLGKHQCIGQKFAKFEIYLITALMVTAYDMEAVDKRGVPTQMPPVALNNTVISPPDPEVFLRLAKRRQIGGMSVTTPTRDDENSTLVDSEPAQEPQSESSAGNDIRTEKQHRRGRVQILGICASLFFQGWTAGVTGPLIPNIQKFYGLSYTRVSLVFVLQNLAAYHSCNAGGTLSVIGGTLQAATPVVPFPVFLIGNYLSGLGFATLTTAATSYIAAFRYGPKSKMGLVHSHFGLGGLVAPLVATQFAQLSDPDWAYCFIIPLGFAVFNALSLYLLFRTRTQEECLERTGQLRSTDEKEEVQTHAHASTPALSPLATVRAMMSLPAVHYLSLFLFIAVGIELMTAGWIVTFMIEMRGGGPSSGYVASGFWGGLTVGRVILLPVNKFLGEVRAIYLYTIALIGLELIIWFVPNLYASAVAASFTGLLIGPMYPVAMNQTALILPPALLAPSISWLSAVGCAGAAVLPLISGALAARYDFKSMQPLCVVPSCDFFLLTPAGGD
ncbi:MFS domain-containing protein [Mycena kentingensis (nom. inval.)]|nr:MFS domain-containing protein [Mycena kentingensis (nom. inval.)]